MAVPLTGSAEAKEVRSRVATFTTLKQGFTRIAVLDFKSMYPSIMIGHNICYTTRIDPAQPAPEEAMPHLAHREQIPLSRRP